MTGRAIDVYIERGAKRAFASAVAWPGWARSGQDEAAALEAMLASAPRYAKVVAGSHPAFTAPTSASDFRVVERLRGNATTDFGAPDAVPKADAGPVGAVEIRRIGTLIEAAWRAFDDAAKGAKGKTLATGPRGGGRSLEKMRSHVREAEAGYISAIGARYSGNADDDAARRGAVLDGLAASARGEFPARGPRGGERWKPRQFARRLAWHSIDHAWELEDRVDGETVSRSPAPARPTRASGRARRFRRPTRARR